MFRLLMTLIALGFLSAALAGCHAEAGGGVSGSTTMLPAP